MARQTGTLLAAALGASAATPLLFASPAGQQPGSQQPQQQQAKSALRGQGAASSSSGPSSAVAATALVAGGGVAVTAALGRRKGNRKGQRAPRVVAQALGSIEQFRVFGPPEDPFEIETDVILGVGGQGTVYRCFRQSAPNVKYAVKTIPIWRLLMDPSSAEKIREIRKEVDVLLKIQGHPNVCQCIGCYDAFREGTSEAQYIMMVMEIIDGGELASYIKDGQQYLQEAVAKNVFLQTVEGLKFIHDQQVVHRDIKAENILVCGKELTTTTQIKLIDFGVAKSVSNTMARSCVGTTEIMAPELVCAKLMIAPKGVNMQRHGPFTFKSPAEESPGFGIISQRTDGKGAMVNGVDAVGQAANYNIGDGWAIAAINGIDITEMPFVKDFNELGASTQGGVTAIAEILGSLSSDFQMEFVELPKREFSEKVDVWSLGVTLYTMLAGVTPFGLEEKIVNGEYDEQALAHCSPEAKDLIRSLLKLNPMDRLTLDQCKQHPWCA